MRSVALGSLALAACGLPACAGKPVRAPSSAGPPLPAAPAQSRHASEVPALATLAPPPVLAAPVTAFDPVDDAFAFGNGLRWDYDTSFDTEGAPSPPPLGDYDQRCSQMSRAARQFFRSARFAPEQPRVSDEEIARRIRAVLRSNPRLPENARDPIVIPGFANLREFSAAYEASLKAAIGGRWRAYFQRGNWRMIFHFPDRHQQTTARALIDSLDAGQPPIVHLVRFPKITINHSLLIHRAVATTEAIDFYAYDPNHPGIEIAMRYDRAEAGFSLQPTFYWPGGRVIAYEVFHGWWY